MIETLALKYRPRAFSDLVGQRSVRVTLQQMVLQDKVPTGMVFAGVRGTGKTTTGRILAAALNCEGPRDNEPPPCGDCPRCKAIFGGNSLDVMEQDAASNGNVADIRALTEALRYSVGGEKRVVLLDEAHSMSREAFNALLKTLEEPPPSTVFILLTTEAGKILETVLSRLMPFEFRRITTADIAGRLQYIVDREGFEIAPELLPVIAERSHGGMRDAVMTLDQVTRVGVKTIDEFNELVGESDFAPGLIRAMTTGDFAQVFGLLDSQLIRTGDVGSISTQITRTLRDILVIKAGGVVHRQGAALDMRRELSAMIEEDKVVQGLRVLWDLKTKVRAGDDPRSMLELAAVMLTEALTGQSKPRAAAAPVGKLSLSQMRAQL